MLNVHFFLALNREDWGLDDPTGKSNDEFIMTAKIIENKILDLRERIIFNKI